MSRLPPFRGLAVDPAKRQKLRWDENLSGLCSIDANGNVALREDRGILPLG